MLGWQQYFGLFICGIIVVCFFIFLNYVINRVFEFFRNFSIKPFDKNEFDHFLAKHFPYYYHLSESGKEKFIKRVKWFKEHKLFYGKEELVLTNEMVLHVSACFAQLTFGLKDYRLSSYNRIFLYPDFFYSGLLKADVKGLTFKHTAIHLSWKNFKEGYDNPNDKLNLGLHELAHALKFDLEDELGFDNHFATYIDDWQRISESEFKELKNEGSSFLRAYGGANREEFFAVCVEHFFEAPAEFEKELPDIYNHLCYLLLQNPQNKINDYALTESFLKDIHANNQLIPVGIKKPQSELGKNFYGWSLMMFVTGLIIGVPVYMHYSDMILKENSFFRNAALPVFVLGLLQSVIINIKGFNNLGYFLVYNFIGFVFLTLALFVFTNFLLGGKEIITNLYPVRYVDLKVVEGKVTENYLVTLTNNELKNFNDIRTFNETKVVGISKKNVEDGMVFMLLQTEKGFWRINNVLNKELMLIAVNNSETVLVK